VDPAETPTTRLQKTEILYAMYIYHMKRALLIDLDIFSRAKKSRQQALEKVNAHIRHANAVLSKYAYLLQEGDRECVYSFIKNMKVDQVRFGMPDGGRSYYFMRDKLMFPGSSALPLAEFASFYLHSEVLDGRKINERKDTALSDLLNETPIEEMSNPEVVDKLELCLKNGKHGKNRYTDDFLRIATNNEVLTPTKKVLYKILVKILYR
jgi:hypothetical protein